MDRPDSELKLLMTRQRLKDAMDEVMSEKVVDIEVYRRLAAKLEVVRLLLCECRKFNLFHKSKLRGFR